MEQCRSAEGQEVTVSRAPTSVPSEAEGGTPNTISIPRARGVESHDGLRASRRFGARMRRAPAWARAGAGRLLFGPQAGTFYVVNEHDIPLVLRRPDGAEFRLAPLERHETPAHHHDEWHEELDAARARDHVMIEPPAGGGFWAQVTAAAIVVGLAASGAYWLLARTGHTVWFAVAVGMLALAVMATLAVWRGTAQLARLGQFVLVLL